MTDSSIALAKVCIDAITGCLVGLLGRHTLGGLGEWFHAQVQRIIDRDLANPVLSTVAKHLILRMKTV